jgi:hypothetical protein
MDETEKTRERRRRRRRTERKYGNALHLLREVEAVARGREGGKLRL